MLQNTSRQLKHEKHHNEKKKKKKKKKNENRAITPKLKRQSMTIQLP